MAWPDWAVTTAIDTRDVWPTVWQAVLGMNHRLTATGAIEGPATAHHEALWGCAPLLSRAEYRERGRTRESDLVRGIRHS